MINIHNDNEYNEYLKKYFTIEGIDALTHRLKSLVALYQKQVDYPFTARMVGFLPLIIKNREQHEAMIQELKQILGIEHIILEDI